LKTEINSKKRSISRKEIVSEAIALAAEQGWHKLTVRELATRLNYAPPVLYEHFQNKDDLLHTIMLDGFEMMSSQIHGAIVHATDPSEKLKLLGLERFRFATEHPALHTLMFSTNCSCGQQELIINGMCAAKSSLAVLLQSISGRTDDCADLVTNFIALVRGYTYMSTELPTHLSHAQFFNNVSPEAALREAILRFIKSIENTNT
jgi:AcrR family transcriptional regulator